MEEFRSLARRVAGELPAGSSVLEAAPGPGYFAIELAKLGDFRITGLDISATLVAIARKQAEQANADVRFERGDVAGMPFDAGQFDFIVCRAAFKNFSAPVAALQEMWRVLKPGGRALIIDLRRDASPESISAAAKGMNVSTVNRLIVYFTFRLMLLRRAYTKSEMERMIGRTSFHSFQIGENPLGFEILLQKDVPAVELEKRSS